MTSSFDWGDDLPVLDGRRVQLRPLSDRDAPALYEVFGDPAVMAFWGSPPLGNLDGAAALVGEIRTAFGRRRLFQWGFSLPAANQLLGTCTLFNVDRAHRRAELGVALRRDRWGQGLATDALGTLIRFAFERLDLHRLEADIDPHNDRSLRLFERQGFRREGYLRERWHHLGGVHDGVFLGLLRREWVGRPEPPPFLIRAASPHEAPALPAIERAAAALFAPYGLQGVMGALLTSIDDLRAGAADGRLFVAEVGGTAVGFALCSPLGDALHLDELDVLPEHGRRGIGAALVRAVAALAAARGCPAVTLSTLRSIPWNAPFYARLGFRVLEPRELTPELRALSDHERARGLPMDDRVLMRREG